MTAVESFRFLVCTISQDTEWDIPIDYCQKGPAEAVLPSPAEEVQPATGAAETVLLCHHWIRPLHINNCLIQHSYQIWHQKTTEGSPDCWANHWYNPPHSPRTVLIQSEQKNWQNHSGPLTSSTPPFELLPSGRCYKALSTSPTRHRNSFLPQAIHLMNTWILNNKHEKHNTIIHLFI